MRLIHCDNCEMELELAFDRYEIDDYITQGDLHFCDMSCHDVYCQKFTLDEEERILHANNEPDNKKHNI